MRYIRKNYKKELSLDVMGDVFHMNGVYLGQVLKKEVGMTFLKISDNVQDGCCEGIIGERTVQCVRSGRTVRIQDKPVFQPDIPKECGHEASGV